MQAAIRKIQTSPNRLAGSDPSPAEDNVQDFGPSSLVKRDEAAPKTKGILLQQKATDSAGMLAGKTLREATEANAQANTAPTGSASLSESLGVPRTSKVKFNDEDQQLGRSALLPVVTRRSPRDQTIANTEANARLEDILVDDALDVPAKG